jgi:hypothetical protein
MSVHVVEATWPFHLEIDHWRAGVWLGTTFQRGEFGITYLPLPESTMALIRQAAGA